jgi:hypothetical protein
MSALNAQKEYVSEEVKIDMVKDNLKKKGWKPLARGTRPTSTPC